jgi:general secretion pathway protein G
MKNQNKNHLRIASAKERGMSLIEIMIVVAIIAMVAGGVAVVAVPQMKKAQIKNAETAARVIRGAVQNWQVSNSDYGTCPTVQQLISDKILDAGQNNEDPWGQPYGIKCDGEEIVVSSAGPDKKPNNQDDIVIPKGAKATE